MYFKTIYHSPIGEISLISDKEFLCGAWFLGQKYFEKGNFELLVFEETTVLKQAKHWLDAYFKGENPLCFQKLKVRGTVFQEAVWQELLKIPFGKTVTYGQLATILDCQSAQAIGQAVARNPFILFVPCHRVLTHDGQLGGFVAGLDKKEALLYHESKDDN